MTKTLLVVDDDPRNRKLLDALLRAEGYAVRCVDGGAGALAAIAAEPPDAILLDLMMPGMDGFEVVRRIKADPGAARVPIVMVTAIDDEGSRARLAAAGVADLIVKPVDRWQMKACLEKLFAEGEAP